VRATLWERVRIQIPVIHAAGHGGGPLHQFGGVTTVLGKIERLDSIPGDVNLEGSGEPGIVGKESHSGTKEAI
jgi:hypothetical protein